MVASTAEVYQTPAVVPTPETIPLMLPDSLNPRYSYGGSKIVTELIAFNYAKEHYRKVQVFRPHNVYGPNMGWKHVVPQFILRALDAARTPTDGARSRSRAMAPRRARSATSTTSSTASSPCTRAAATARSITSATTKR